MIWVSRYSSPKVSEMLSKAIICRRAAAERTTIPAAIQAQKLTATLTKKILCFCYKKHPTILATATLVLKWSRKTQNIART